jgi:hypothetical protein
MAAARRREAWDHTALLAALIVNWSGYARKGLKVADFHPFMAAAGGGGHRVRVTADNIEVLKALITPATAGPGRLSK